MKRFYLTIFIIIICFIKTNAQIDFASAVSQKIGSRISSLTIGDVNNDGLNDAVVTTSNLFDAEHDYSIFVFLQQADGHIGEPIQYKYSNQYGSFNVVQIADVNNDELNDVVLTFGNSVYIFYQNQMGNLNKAIEINSGTTADGMKTGDLNQDGLIDIAVCHWNDPFINVFYQLRTGGFKAIRYAVQNSGEDELDINDMNGDGLNDLIYMPGHSPASTFYILYQDKITGLLSNPVNYDYEHGGFSNFHGISTGDLNNDGRNDLVGSLGSNREYAWITVIYQQADGKMGPATFLPSYDMPTPVEIADLNCDEVNEIIVGHNAWTYYSVWEQDKNGKFTDYKLFGSLFNVGPYSLAIGDLNGDSRKDVLSTNGESVVHFMFNTSAPAGTLPTDTLIVQTSVSPETEIMQVNWSTTTGIIKTGDCLLQTKYNLITTTYRTLNFIEADSLFPRSFKMCGVQQTDTIRHHFTFYSTVYFDHTDSTILNVDTLIENSMIAGTWTHDDTISSKLMPYIYILVNHHYHNTGDTLNIITDSLLVSSIFLTSELKRTVTTVYTGSKCGNAVVDSIQNVIFLTDSVLIDSDSALISQSILKSYSGIIETKQISDIRLYPNPAADESQLEFSNELQDQGPFIIRINNSKGKQVWENKITASDKINLTIKGKQFHPGIYLVQIIGNNSYGSVKLVITR